MSRQVTVAPEDVEAYEEEIQLRRPDGKRYKQTAREMLNAHTILGGEGKQRSRRFLRREYRDDGSAVYWFPPKEDKD